MPSQPPPVDAVIEARAVASGTDAPAALPEAQKRAQALAKLPRVLRFLLSGGFNTAASYGVYVFLLSAWGHRWAYIASFAFGMVLSYGLLRWLVFQSAGRTHAWVWVALTHVGQLVLGLGVVEVWVRVLHGPPALAALAAVAVCVPLTYVVHRWVFRPPEQKATVHVP